MLRDAFNATMRIRIHDDARRQELALEPEGPAETLAALARRSTKTPSAIVERVTN